MEVPHTRSATRATVTPTRQNQTRTTVSARPNDHVGQARNIEANVATWSGTVYVAFVFDVYSRRIVGWRAATRMTTELVLDCLEHAIWTRTQDGISDLTGLVHHTDAGSQYTSFAFTSRLIEAGVDPSVGSVGDAYDNALAESQIGTYKTELIRPHSPWRNVEHVRNVQRRRALLSAASACGTADARQLILVH